MASRARCEKGCQVKGLALHNGAATESIDTAVKDIIDNLIVPKLIEEFLGLYVSAPRTGQESFTNRKPKSQPDSELNSTP